MRPLVLKMSAFGSYAGTQSIEFAELKGRTFFLIHGPTGAGKTTILDAICFALYGDASGETRDSKSLRSHHADAAVGTEVTFDFAVGQDQYRVQRIPEQERLKRRGEGTTVKAAEAALWKLELDGTTRLITTGWGKVTEKIEGTLGFKSGQFRQVVLLPQGEFRKLLLADSKERQGIMQTLFKTDIYRAVEELLKDKAHEIKQQFEELTKESKWILQEAKVQSLAELREILEESKASLTETVREVVKQDALLAQAQANLTTGTINQGKLDEQRAAKQAWRELQAQTAVINSERDEWLLATRAAVLADAEQAQTRLELDVCALLKQQQVYQEKLDVAQREVQLAQSQLAAEKSREQERVELAREILELDSMAKRTAMLEEAVEILQLCTQKQAAVFTVKQETEKRHADLRQKIQVYQEEQQSLLTLALAGTGLQYQFAQAQQTLARRQQLEDLQAQYQALAERHAVLTAREEQKKAAFNATCIIHGDMQKHWLEGQAAVLAAALTEDNPCPVCGSRAHPAKAVGSGIIPTEKQLKAQRALMEKQEIECRQITEQLSQCQVERDMIIHKMRDFEQILGALALCSAQELEQTVKEYALKINRSREAEMRIKTLEQALTTLQEQTVVCAKQTEECEVRYREAQSAYQAAAAVLEERQTTIPEEYRDIKKLIKAQQAAAEKLSNFKQNLEKAQQRMEAAVMQLSTGEEAYRQTSAAYAAGRERLSKEQELFVGRIREAGFPDRQAYEQAKRPADYLQKTAEHLKGFDSALAAAAERIKRADAAAQNVQLPDIAALQQKVTESKEQHEQVLKERTVLETREKQQTLWLEKLVSQQTALEKIEEYYRVIGRLADVANGRNDYGLTFQRFVLGALLDDVAAAANERLKLMSRGRYYLQRTMDRARRNAAGGLDLEVFDNYTGNMRGVRTLSGGETFLASLALALGLADVVQAYSGGMHLDTIFIDEGFGSLDPESLDFAMQALLDLQRGGRLVGIISHVPELRERIDARLEITATDKGSSAHFYVG